MSFEAQSKLAKSKKKAYSVNSTFKKNRIDYAPGTPQYGNFGADKHLGVGVSAAYASEDGYSLQVNPYTGDTEMFVRGTTFKGYGREWASNVLESDIVKYGFGGPYKYLSKQLRSRGGAKNIWRLYRSTSYRICAPGAPRSGEGARAAGRSEPEASGEPADPALPKIKVFCSVYKISTHPVSLRGRSTAKPLKCRYPKSNGHVLLPPS